MVGVTVRMRNQRSTRGWNPRNVLSRETDMRDGSMSVPGEGVEEVQEQGYSFQESLLRLVLVRQSDVRKGKMEDEG